MREITGRLTQAGEFEIIVFGDKVRQTHQMTSLGQQAGRVALARAALCEGACMGVPMRSCTRTPRARHLAWTPWKPHALSA
jgi:hypothetical protein